MDAYKNFAINVDGNPVYVTMIESDFDQKFEEYKEKYPDRKITYTIWYD